MEQEVDLPAVHKSTVIKYWAGIPSALFSILFFYIAFSEGIESKDFWTSIITAVGFGLAVFVLFLKNKKVVALLSSVLLFGLGSIMLDSDTSNGGMDALISYVWIIGFYMAGLSYLFKVFGTTVSAILKSIVKSKAFKWIAIITTILLVVTTLVNVIAGLSATTIIIILLILIWLK